jgi:hypothetical protein
MAALRDQPYIPLYVQDLLSDEKLKYCSATAHGVYFLLICILHKQENYGCFLLEHEFKENKNKINGLSAMLSYQMPFKEEVIYEGISDLIKYKVMHLDGDMFFQKRMVRDGKISDAKAQSGKAGGLSSSKQYGKPGFLYFMSDGLEKHRMGVSKDPLSRLYRIRSNQKLSKTFKIIYQIPVTNMGHWDDAVKQEFSSQLQEEWITGDITAVKEYFDLLSIQDEKTARDEGTPAKPVDPKPEKPKQDLSSVDEQLEQIKSKLIDDIVDHFKYTAPQHSRQRSMIMEFVSTLPHKEKLDFLIVEFESFKKLMARREEKYRVKFNSFIGTQKDAWNDGRWDDNWTEQLNNDIRSQQNGTKKQSDPGIRSNHNPTGRRTFGKL